ncbi:hypothetical protein C6P42_002059 [Pichia californica]|nr:hypothetical protein C6P42_002059 [[Candida] californica]
MYEEGNKNVPNFIKIQTNPKTIGEKYNDATKSSSSWIKLNGKKNFIPWWNKTNMVISSLCKEQVLNKITDAHSMNSHHTVTRELDESINDYLVTTVNISGLTIGSGDVHDNIINILKRVGMIMSYKELATAENEFSINIRKSSEHSRSS